MTLAQIAVLVALAAILGRLKRGRSLALLAVSTGVVFWLQPAEPLATLGFWLPSATIALTAVAWVVTSAPEARSWKDAWPAIGVVVGLALLLGLSGPVAQRLNPALVVPSARTVTVTLLAIAIVAAGLWHGKLRPAYVTAALTASILLVFLLVKWPWIFRAGVAWWSGAFGEGREAGNGIPFTWLGFSYVAFRLLHTIRDQRAGRLPVLTLGEYINYVIFFPAFTAGPIDRAERFVKDLRSPLELSNDDLLAAITRLVSGLFKKFVLADMLAVIAVNDVLVLHVRTAGWMWVFLYAYAFRIYLDFSGYTDMAIGMGRLLGVRLPENFDAPYLKPNLALFWNSWHMSLTQWFRSYVFNPLTRALRTTRQPLPLPVAVLATQMTTMVLIGLWHGVSWSFALWGMWHGLGLFIHNRWLEFGRARWPLMALSPGARRAAHGLGVLATFHYVCLGWLLFGLSTPSLAWQAFRVLVGAG